MSIIPQRPEDEPACPQSGIAGGPIHPAHAMEVIIADRVYAVTPKDETLDLVLDPTVAAMAAASSRQDGMKLYEIMGSPIHPRVNYYSAAFFMCLTCGFVLPAQQMSRG